MYTCTDIPLSSRADSRFSPTNGSAMSFDDLGHGRVPRLLERQEVFNWDRGSDVPAANPFAAAIVDFLCAWIGRPRLLRLKPKRSAGASRRVVPAA